MQNIDQILANPLKVLRDLRIGRGNLMYSLTKSAHFVSYGVRRLY